MSNIAAVLATESTHAQRREAPMPGLSEAVVQQVRERLDFEAVFKEFLPTLSGRGVERTALCIFHENTELPGALGVNVRDGVYLCRNPSCAAAGDVFSFYQRVRSLDFPSAVRELAERVHVVIPSDMLTPAEQAAGPQPPIDESVVDAAHERLVNSPAYLRQLSEKRGINIDTVRTFQLGHDGERFFIPIRDVDGEIRNIRRYRMGERDSRYKMISWREGYGQARLFPFDNIVAARQNQRPVLLLEGELDAILANQLGFHGMSVTSGAGSWRDEWSPLFGGVDVWVCYDIDAAGKAGAAKVARALFGHARSVKVLNLPITEPDNGDFTDFIQQGYTAADLIRLGTDTPLYVPPTDEAAEAEAAAALDPDEIPLLHLSQASKAENYNRPIRMPVMVSGKTTAPYLVPEEVRMKCSMPGVSMCERCPNATAAGNMVKTLTYENNQLLQLTGVSTAAVQKMVKAKCGIPGKCDYVRTEVLRAINLEEVQLIPEVERNTDADAPYVTRRAYYKGHGLQSNRSYLMTGTTVPDPAKQLATHIITDAVPSQSNIDAFRLSQQAVDALKVFRPTAEGVEGLWSHLDTIYEDLERVTRIYQRRDLMLAVDLTYLSMLGFTFQGERLRRGWVELLVIGDSRTGKSTAVERLMDHYGAGELSSGENTSLAGLVGGLHQIGDSWALQWGRIPLNDRRLLVIDEAGNLQKEHIARMSSMRSSGIAEIVKVHTERTNARTRMIWISNPRSAQSLTAFSQGVLAVKELIGAPEDIARFDLVVTAATGDVPSHVVNAERTMLRPETFTRDVCHQRIMWAWSRSAEQVEWAEGTVRLLLRLALEQGNKYRYATEVPLVEPNEQRVKIARLAVAAAALFFSTDDSGERIIVKPEHVQFAVQFLEKLYEKPSLAFAEWAKTQQMQNELSNNEQIAQIIRAVPGSAQQFMSMEKLSQRDVQEILNVVDRDALRRIISVLRNSNFLLSKNNLYVKSTAAIRWLRTEILGGEHSDLNSGSLAAATASADVPPDEPPF